MLDTNKLWGSALSEIEVSTSKANFSTWFKNTTIYKEDSGTVYLSVPNTFVKEWLANKYHKNILKALRNNFDTIRSVEYVIAKSAVEPKKDNNVHVEDMGFNEQLRMNEIYTNKDSGLNPRYIFENFIVGSFNELSYAASQAIIKNPGMSYNPLFIYGGTGLGKTHLIQAIGNHIKNLDESKKVYYLTTEKFTVDYLESLQNNKVYAFKEKYRKYDLLIIDDVQFISGKEKTQEEMFHLFNSLYDNNKQIVFSSDQPPKRIPHLEERLRSRFEGGMIVDIGKPDYESRVVILKSKLKESPFTPSDEILEYIASIIQENIRELEGVLNSIICQSQLKKRNLTIQEIRPLIKSNIKPQRTVSIKDVIKLVADFYNVEERMLYEKTRRKEVVKPRQVVMYLLREDFGTSYPYIGQKLGGRDHTTVIHACEKIKRCLKEDTLLNQEMEQIKLLLHEHEPVAV